MAGRKVRDEADARALLAAVRESGVPRAVWARRHGIDARSLNAWRLILARRDVEPAPMTFLELVPKSDAEPLSALRVRRGDLVVEIPDRFDDAQLVRVLRAMAAC